MTAIEGMLQQPVAYAIGWALLQFLWQGALIAVLTAALLAALQRSAADVRYVVSAIAMSLMLTMPVVTAVQALRTTPAPSAAPVASVAVDQDEQPAAPAAGPMVSAEGSAPAPAGLAVERQSLEPWLPLFVGVWLAGVAVLTIRLLSGWMWIQRMKSHRARPAGDALQAVAGRLMRRLHIARPVRFLESSLIDVPTVIGWLKPVVLLPASVLAGLTPRQVEAILAHELAHIRRHDYLVNLLQAVVETLLFYHPAVWWVSRRIRIERENCCDDLAVNLCGDPVAYAAALAELEGLRRADGQLALAASGGSLLQRVRRLLGAPSHAGRAPAWLAAGVAILVIVGLSAGAAGSDAFLETDQAATGSPREADDRPAAVPVVPATPVTRATAVIAVPATAPERGAAAQVATTAATASTPEAVRPAVAAVVASTPIAESDVVTPAIAHATTVTAAQQPVTAPVAATTPTAHAVPGVPAVAAVAARADQAPVVASEPVTTIQRSSDGEKSGNYIWSDNGLKFEVNYRGDIAFSDDDTDVRSISPGGFLRIKDGGRFGTDNSIEFRAGGGAVERRFWVGTAERPFDPEGRRWLAQMLPKFIRQSGIGAAARAARIFKSGGATAVLAEITLVEGSWAKRVYFAELLKSPGLTARNVQQALAQAGREIDSDFELASLLISGNALLSDDATRKTYLDAARSIGSDFELRRVLSSILKSGAVASPIAASLLDASTSIDSDFEQASLLVQLAKQQPLDAAVRGAFFKALATVQSAFERRRVLTAVLQRTDLSPEARVQALESTALVTSDFEAASILMQFVKANAVEGTARAPFFRAVSSIDSAFERGRVLQALARRTDVPDEAVLDILRSAQGINGHLERAQVLLAVAGSHQLTREARDAYIDAAEKLGDLEQGRVLSALVKNERRKEATGGR